MSEWKSRIIEAMRKRHRLKDDEQANVVVMPAEVSGDAVDPMLFTARITKAVIDRDREVVLPEGGIFTEFDRSGAIFWNHDYDRPVAVPVGDLVHGNGYIDAKARFIDRDGDTVGEWLPDYARAFVKAMADAERSAGVSIGFVPVEVRKPTKKDKEQFGEDVLSVISKWKLLEWSIAPVQANPESVVTAVGKSIGGAACKALFGVDAPHDEQDAGSPSHGAAVIPDIGSAAIAAKSFRTAQKLAQMHRKAVLSAQKKARQQREKLLREKIRMVPHIARARARGQLYV